MAIENVRAFHKREMDRSWETSRNGATTGQRVRPLAPGRCLYVPGGHGAYPSTLLMAAVPAQVAGVDEICVCAPMGRDGRVSEKVLAVAGLLGLDEVYAVGGAQAIAAMAFGTESIPAVNKIVGPGNDYVTAAKLRGVRHGRHRRAARPERGGRYRRRRSIPGAGRPRPDGPGRASLRRVGGVFLSPSENLIEEVEPLLSGEPAELITLVRVRDLAHAAELSNLYAPEHAHIISEDHEAVLNDLREVGMVAIGDWSPVALGDYAAGPSHALPTGGAASWASAFGTHDFTARTNYIHFSRDALGELGPHVERLARLEGFENHAESVGVRFGKADGDGD